MRKKLCMISIALIAIVIASAIWLRREASQEVDLAVLKRAELIVAFQQDWKWNYNRTRERSRKYFLQEAFDSTLAELQGELLPKGWTEHKIESTSPIRIFREKVGGYVVGVEESSLLETTGCVITVSDPNRPAGLVDKVVAYVQHYDGNYVPAGDQVLRAYREFQAKHRSQFTK